jgi:Ca-activated chloride channel homolog
MNEKQEAEIFNRELDKLLAGEPIGDAAPEVREDLLMASRLASLDLAAESKVKRALKAQLLAEPAPGFFKRMLSWITAHPMQVAAAGGFAVLTLAFGLHELNQFMPKFQLGELAGDIREESGTTPVSPISASNVPSQPVDPNPPSPVFQPGSVGLDQLKASAEPEASYLQQEALSRNYPRASKRAVSAGRGMGFGRLKGMISGAAAPMSNVGGGGMDSYEAYNREGYAHIAENGFKTAKGEPLSTFSIDVDAASYANVRRILSESRMPPEDAVRIEEMINYFHYDYPEPKGEHPFSITTELGACPWQPKHKLVKIGLKGKSVAKDNLPPSNLVFLIDTSGSMGVPRSLPLLKRAFALLVEQMRPQDRVAIVTYAGSAGLVLPSTPGSKKAQILEALENLNAGGSTAGGEGIELAYKVAFEHFDKEANNRVILATDGDFNVGASSDGELVTMIEKKRDKGVFLSVLGFGSGNVQDSKMEQLADKGNGHYAYIDDIMEARKVLVQEMGGTLLTIAKDVKIQVEFNPARVQAYRLIGYENRALAAQDFNDDKKDAGELGSGHTVTALYEIVPPGVSMNLPGVDALKYQKTEAAPEKGDASGELLTVKFRYKQPTGDTSKLITHVLEDKVTERPSEDFRFASSVAGFGMLLRHSENKGDLTYLKVKEMAEGSLGKDAGGYRAEMVRLVEKAGLLDPKK